VSLAQDQAPAALLLLGFCSILADLPVWTRHLIIWNASWHPLLDLLVLSVEAGNLFSQSSRHRFIYIFFFVKLLFSLCLQLSSSLSRCGGLSSQGGGSLVDLS